MSSKDLSIYVHIPFCLRKCFYCDFTSYDINLQKKLNEYALALSKEIKMRQIECHQVVKSIFFGGGTPLVMGSKLLSSLLDTIKSNFSLSQKCEISIEANPDTVSKRGLAHLKKIGFNRISLGAQSLDDKTLEKLGRVHDSESVHKAVSVIKAVRIKNFSIDLMVGLPEQTMTSFKGSLNKILDFDPPHISIYSLSVEKGTVFERLQKEGNLSLPDEESEIQMFQEGLTLLREKNYTRYEISNFSHPGFECIHNVRYWEHKEYIGFGCGAHSFTNGERRWNTKDIQHYLKSVRKNESVVEGKEILTKEQEMKEAIMLGLRMTRGIRIKEFNQRYQCDLIRRHENILCSFVDKNFLQIKEGYMSLTETGILYHDEVAGRFF